MGITPSCCALLVQVAELAYIKKKKLNWSKRFAHQTRLPWACLPAGGWSLGRRPAGNLALSFGSHRLHFFWYTPWDHRAEIRIPCEAVGNANR